MPEIFIPTQCTGCPRIGMMVLVMERMDENAQQMTEAAMSDEGPIQMRQQIMVQTGLSVEEADEAVEGSFTNIRQLTSMKLDQIDHQKEHLHADARALSIGCNGVLRMRARSKDGQTVTAAVCTSRNFNRSDSTPDPTYVKYS